MTLLEEINGARTEDLIRIYENPKWYSAEVVAEAEKTLLRRVRELNEIKLPDTGTNTRSNNHNGYYELERRTVQLINGLRHITANETISSSINSLNNVFRLHISLYAAVSTFLFGFVAMIYVLPVAAVIESLLYLSKKRRSSNIARIKGIVICLASVINLIILSLLLSPMTRNLPENVEKLFIIAIAAILWRQFKAGRTSIRMHKHIQDNLAEASVYERSLDKSGLREELKKSLFKDDFNANKFIDLHLHDRNYRCFPSIKGGEDDCSIRKAIILVSHNLDDVFVYEASSIGTSIVKKGEDDSILLKRFKRFMKRRSVELNLDGSEKDTLEYWLHKLYSACRASMTDQQITCEICKKWLISQIKPGRIPNKTSEKTEAIYGVTGRAMAAQEPPISYETNEADAQFLNETNILTKEQNRKRVIRCPECKATEEVTMKDFWDTTQYKIYIVRVKSTFGFKSLIFECNNCRKIFRYEDTPEYYEENYTYD